MKKELYLGLDGTAKCITISAHVLSFLDSHLK